MRAGEAQANLLRRCAFEKPEKTWQNHAYRWFSVRIANRLHTAPFRHFHNIIESDGIAERYHHTDP